MRASQELRRARKTAPQRASSENPQQLVERKPLKRFRRVWFLGAGFSAAMGYPLGRGLVADLCDYLEGRDDRLKKRMPKKCRRRYANSLAGGDYGSEAGAILQDLREFAQRYLARSDTDLANTDVAEFFSVAQALAEQGLLVDNRRPEAAARSGSRPMAFSRLYSDLAAVTRSYFVDICSAVPAWAWPADIRAVVDGLDPRYDAIVSFNWDEEVDFYLSTERDHGKAEYDVAYTAASWDPHRFLVLKPHGSIGWYDLAQGIGNEDLYFIADHVDTRIPREGKRLVAYNDFVFPIEIDDEHHERLLSCPPVITPPTFGKRFPYPEQRLIWSDVIDICRHAAQFFFLGYSLPPDDFLTKAAIRCALDERKKKREKSLHSERLRCLTVTRFDGHSTEPPQQIVNNMRDVFGGVSANHFLDWTFGNDNEDLFSEIVKALRSAAVL
jgi:hypothetical protein